MNLKKWIPALLGIMWASCATAQPSTITIKPLPPGEDATLTVLDAIEKCRNEKITKIAFEPGEYLFRSNLAPERYFYVTNTDEKMRRFTFDLTGLSGLEIDGQGAHFVMDGYVSPFLLNESKNITIRNLSFDYKRAFHSEGEIVAVYPDSIDIAFSAEYPYRVDNTTLMFTGHEFVDRDCSGLPRKEPYPFWHLLEFTADRHEPIRGKEYLPMQTVVVKEVRPGVVRFFHKGITGKVGNTMVFNPEYRYMSGIVISDSENVRVDNVTIYHTGAMGIVGQCSKDIRINRVKVIAPEGRMVSTTADATHFVHCTGVLEIRDCLFESMMDDATNIHGVYMRIDQILSPNELIVKRVHYQQYGFDIFKPGMRVELVDAGSLNTLSENTVTAVTNYNKEYLKLTFENPVGADIELGDVVASIDHNPDVLFTGCTVRKNRARGMLLASKGKILIENNYFHTHAATVHMEGDANFWFEQAGVRDLVMRNNFFDECNYSLIFGHGVIFTTSTIAEQDRPTSRYNRNIVIEDNTFRLVAPCVLNLYCIDNLLFRNNKVFMSEDPYYRLPQDIYYDMEARGIGMYYIRDSSNIRIEE